jgi:hypothetical protein
LRVAHGSWVFALSYEPLASGFFRIDIPGKIINMKILIFLSFRGGVAQLVRACGSYPQCPGFKSLHRHQTEFNTFENLVFTDPLKTLLFLVTEWLLEEKPLTREALALPPPKKRRDHRYLRKQKEIKATLKPP